MPQKQKMIDFIQTILFHTVVMYFIFLQFLINASDIVFVVFKLKNRYATSHGTVVTVHWYMRFSNHGYLSWHCGVE